MQSVTRQADTSPYEPQPTGTFISRMSHLLVPLAIDPPFFSLSRLGFVDAAGNNHNGRRRRQPRNGNQPTDATARHATVPHTTADGPSRPHGEGLLGVVRPARRPQGLPSQDPEGREAHHLRRGAEGERAAKRTKAGLCLSRADRLYVLQGRGVFLYFLDKKGAASVPRAGSERGMLSVTSRRWKKRTRPRMDTRVLFLPRALFCHVLCSASVLCPGFSFPEPAPTTRGGPSNVYSGCDFARSTLVVILFL